MQRYNIDVCVYGDYMGSGKEADLGGGGGGGSTGVVWAPPFS